MDNLENQNLSGLLLADTPMPEQPDSPSEEAIAPTEQALATLNPLSAISPPPLRWSPRPVSVVRLWTPGTIAGVTFLGGYLSGSALAAINWYRLDLRQKAHLHLIGSLWTVFSLGLLGLWLPNPSLVYLLGFLLMIGMSRSLFVQMENDIAAYRTAEQQVIEANGCLGLLIGLGLGLLYVICLTLLFTFVPALMIGAVLFLLTIFVLLVPAGESVF